MISKTLAIFLGLQLLFLGTGALLIAVAIIYRPVDIGQVCPSDEGTCLLLRTSPLSSAIANAALIFLTFLISIPGVMRSKDRMFLRIHSWGLVVCGILSLIVGLIIWVSTLQTRANLGNIWAAQSPAEQSALQKEFNCCGYFDINTPPFVKDNTCTGSLAATKLGPCIGPFSSFANNLLDVVFTAMFGLVAVDGLLFLSTIVMIKKREERERYRLIDAKSGYGGI